MNDYKELVKNLNKNIYGQCSEYCKDIAVLYKEAADAIEQLAKERDAAIADLRLTNPCVVCKHFSKENCGCDAFYECAVDENDLWEWRGVQNE